MPVSSVILALTLMGSTYSTDAEKQISSTSDTVTCRDSLIEKLYQIQTDSLHVMNKEHLLKKDPNTAKEIKFRRLEELGEEQRKDEIRRNKRH